MSDCPPPTLIKHTLPYVYSNPFLWIESATIVANLEIWPDLKGHQNFLENDGKSARRQKRTMSDYLLLVF